MRDPAAHQLSIHRVTEAFHLQAWQVADAIPSPITGAEGNQEFLLYAHRA